MKLGKHAKIWMPLFIGSFLVPYIIPSEDTSSLVWFILFIVGFYFFNKDHPRVAKGVVRAFELLFSALGLISYTVSKSIGNVRIIECRRSGDRCICVTDEGKIVFEPFSKYVELNETSMPDSEVRKHISELESHCY